MKRSLAFLSLAGLALTAGVTLLGWWLSVALSWRHPWLLLGLGIVPLASGALTGLWLHRRVTDRRFGSPEMAARLKVGRSGVLRAIRGVAGVTALGLLVVAAAGPQYGSRTRTLRKRGVDVVVALDFSKSMLARDVRPDRISRAKAELTTFAEDLSGDRVGLVAFAGETIEFPMTNDYAALDLFLRDLGPYDMPVGGTSIGRALVAAERLLERSRPAQAGPVSDDTEDERARVIILMTDGEDHEGDPAAAASDLAEANIRLYTVGIGSRTGEPIPTYADDGTWTGYLRGEDGQPVTTALTAEAEATLTRIAEMTGGKYFRAERGGVGMEQIRRELRRMKQSELEARQVTITEDRFALILLPAFLLLVLEGLLPEAWLGLRRRRRETKSHSRRNA